MAGYSTDIPQHAKASICNINKKKTQINVMEQIRVREWFSLFHFWCVLRQSLLVGISLLHSFSDSKVEDAEM